MPRYNKESFLDLLNEDQPKLETISFETISKVVKNCTEIKNKDGVKKEDTRKEDYFKRNPLAYALSLEPLHSDQTIKKALIISKWYSDEEVEHTMKELINGRIDFNEL